MDFANRPFDELWDYISTPKYRIDRSSRAIRSFKIYLILKKKYSDDRQWYIDVYLKEYGQQWPVSGGKVGQIINDLNVLTNDFNNGRYVDTKRNYISINYRGTKIESQDVMGMMEDIILNSKNLIQINSIPEPVL
jgi:hypothetical protein